MKKNINNFSGKNNIRSQIMRFIAQEVIQERDNGEMKKMFRQMDTNNDGVV